MLKIRLPTKYIYLGKYKLLTSQTPTPTKSSPDPKPSATNHHGTIGIIQLYITITEEVFKYYISALIGDLTSFADDAVAVLQEGQEPKC